MAIITVIVVFVLAISSLSSGTAEMASQSSPKELPEVTKAPQIIEHPVSEEAPDEDPATPKDEYHTIIGSMDFDAEESRILLKIAMAEAEGESIEGKALVMLVVLNRVWSDGFPDTIEGVVFQTYPCRQFSPTEPGGRYWTTEPNEDCYEALALVLSGWDKSAGAKYFESCKGDSWHSRNLEMVLEYGNHRFYK